MQHVTVSTNFSIPYRTAAHPKPHQLLSSSKLWIQTTQVEKIALRAFVHITLALSVNVLAITFFATPISIPIITTIAMLGFTALVATSLYSRFIQKQAEPDPLLRELSEGLQPIAKAMLLYTFNAAGPGIALHEAGHALCAWTLFKHSQLAVSISPFTGYTTYTASHGLTRAGLLLGQERALLLTAAGGFIASMLTSMMSFCTASYLSEGWPTLSKCFQYHAISQLLNEIIYGLTTFFVSRHDISHDFIYLWEMGGIHPLVPLLLLSALLALQVALIYRKAITP